MYFLLNLTFLLSSRTVFKFSTQVASTGPSNMIHLRVASFLTESFLNIFAKIPSVHSCESGSERPYNWPIVTDLGFIM